MVAHSMGAANSLGNIYSRGCNKFVSISHGLGFGITLPNGEARDGGQTCKPENNVLRKLYNRTCIFFTTMRISIPKLWLLAGDDDVGRRVAEFPTLFDAASLWTFLDRT